MLKGIKLDSVIVDGLIDSGCDVNKPDSDGSLDSVLDGCKLKSIDPVFDTIKLDSDG